MPLPSRSKQHFPNRTKVSIFAFMLTNHHYRLLAAVRCVWGTNKEKINWQINKSNSSDLHKYVFQMTNVGSWYIVLLKVTWQWLQLMTDKKQHSMKWQVWKKAKSCHNNIMQNKNFGGPRTTHLYYNFVIDYAFDPTFIRQKLRQCGTSTMYIVCVK